MRFNNRAYTDQQILTTLVAVDNNISGFIKDTEGWRVLPPSTTAVSVTNTLTETALATITIPAGAMGPTGLLMVTAVLDGTDSANAKTWRLRLGGLAGTEFANYSLTVSATGVLHRIIWNANNAASQKSFASNSSNAYGNSTSAPATGAVNTAVAQDLVISGQMAALAETMTLESYLVEVKYGA